MEGKRDGDRKAQPRPFLPGLGPATIDRLKAAGVRTRYQLIGKVELEVPLVFYMRLVSTAVDARRRRRADP